MPAPAMEANQLELQGQPRQAWQTLHPQASLRIASLRHNRIRKSTAHFTAPSNYSKAISSIS